MKVFRARGQHVDEVYRCGSQKIIRLCVLHI